MFRFKLVMIFLCCALIMFTAAADGSDHWNSPRDFEPVVVTGNDFSEFLGDSVSHIFAYTYDQTADKWIQIALQIDEKDDSTHVWVPSPNKLLDSTDEIIFMAGDMGDQVPDPNNWIDNNESRNFDRYEIVAYDPIDPGKTGYVYCYQSPTLEDTCKTIYMNYTVAPSGKASDQIEALSYFQGHNDEGIIDHWEIPISAGGNGIDILDRQKIRVTGFSIKPHELTEDNLIDPAIEYVAGKVRIARKISYTIYDDFEIDDVEIPTYYYPYSIYSSGAGKTIDPIYKIEQIRQSFDLKDEASGMMFHNNFNENIPVDGIQDTNVDTNLVSIPDSVNWLMYSGEQGTILTLMKSDPFGTNRKLYYYDDKSSDSTGDETVETGDGQSWGDAGILISGTSLNVGFYLPYRIYFLSKNQSPSIGFAYAKNFNNPLSISITNKPVPVELASFNASVFKGDVLLTWTTLSETNNYGFEIHRKKGDHSNWQNIAFVEGHNTTNELQQYSYVDQHLTPGIYSYRLKQIDFDGSSTFSRTIEISVAAPHSFSLGQNYPNPFNPTTKIDYQIPEIQSSDVNVNLTIYNLLGAAVRTLISKNQSAGFYSVYWDGKDDRGNNIPTGIYIYRLRAGDYVATKRMVLMK